MSGTGSPTLPMHLEVAGLPVLVVGGGPVALRKIRSCLQARARVTVVALAPCAEVATLAAEHQLQLHVRAFAADDLDGCWLAFTACGTAADADVAAAAQARRVFCVRADSARDPAGSLCPAVLRHDGLTVSVSAGGQPRRAVRLRDQIGAALRAGELGSVSAEAAAASTR